MPHEKKVSERRVKPNQVDDDGSGWTVFRVANLPTIPMTGRLSSPGGEPADSALPLGKICRSETKPKCSLWKNKKEGPKSLPRLRLGIGEKGDCRMGFDCWGTGEKLGNPRPFGNGKLPTVLPEDFRRPRFWLRPDGVGTPVARNRILPTP